MAAAQHTGLCAQDLDDLVKHLSLVDILRILVGQVRVVTADKPHTQDSSCHARKIDPGALQRARAPVGRSVISRPPPVSQPSGIDMPHPDEAPPSPPTPPWALQQASEELYDVDEPEVIHQRAELIASEARERYDERHDEYDDPDQGGEA